MRLPRFTIRSLLEVVLLVSVALAALRASTDVWDGCLLGLALLLLLTATLLAVHRTRCKRAYWLGFSLFGWVYPSASFVPPVESRLPTTKGLADLHSKLPRRETASEFLYRLLVSGDPGGLPSPPQPGVADLTSMGASDWAYSWMFTGAALPGPSGTTENFVRIGHSLLALVVALIGGCLSRRLYDKDHVQMAGGDDHPPGNRRRR